MKRYNVKYRQKIRRYERPLGICAIAGEGMEHKRRSDRYLHGFKARGLDPARRGLEKEPTG